MKNGLRLILFSTFGIGNIFLIISRIFSEKLTDFELGFLEGISIVLLLVGVTYLSWCLIKKENPLKRSEL